MADQNRALEAAVDAAVEELASASLSKEPEAAPSKKALKKQQEKEEKERKKAETAARLEAERAAREANEADYSVGKYGKMPLNQSQERTGKQRTRLGDLGMEKVGQTVLLRARLHNVRAVGSKRVFLVLREKFDTVQAVLTADAENVSKQMLKWAGALACESIVLVEAELVKALEPVKSCSVQDVELKILTLRQESASEPRLPFSLEDASQPDEADSTPRVYLDTRLDNRVIDLRTTANQAIFRIQAGVVRLFREFLDGQQFTEIHTPKIIPAASEGGANVFKVSYFKGEAFLAQSPQLYKQMCICADFERVYEIAPVFRAENSFTHRHMTEFVGLDLEMAFQEHYHEVLDIFDQMFVYIFEGLKTRYAAEMEAIQRQYPFAEFQYLPKSLRLQYKDGIQMLREAGVEIGDHDDMNTEQERKLGRLVKEKYGTDFYMLDKFPLAVRPFYTMPDPVNQGYSNSYDFFIRGEEILSGAQRIHDPALLKERAEAHGVDLKTIQGYLDAFRYGVPPHAGGGIGLERVVMLYLNLGNIRKTSMYPRDPHRVTP
ncbi:hypothetical protein DFJ74DRAFT_482707 [Hyaloraphidium curvatum]|nr:hypothetical protein DFJ74DRAFT_482707 [Hyaloraphidium curvatum]